MDVIKKFISTWFIQIFCVLWAIFLTLDYLNNSAYFTRAIAYFEYTDLIITLLLFTTVFAYLFAVVKKPAFKIEVKNFRGIYHYLFLLFCMMLIMLFYLSKTDISPHAASGAISFLIKTIVLHGGLVIILLAALSTGTFILNKFSVKLEAHSFQMVSIAVGFMVITLGLFLLGIGGLLLQWVVIPFILLLVLPGIKIMIPQLKELLFAKRKSFEIHVAAIATYAFVIFMVAINLCFLTRPFPIGFDSLNLYMNSARLISGYHSLIDGGDAYNWSIMMSLGLVMYKSTAVSLLISVVPGILSILAIYRICIHLKISNNWSLLACALYYSAPIIIWQSHNDSKTDLAVLFITLCGVLLFIREENKVLSQSKIKVVEKKSIIDPELVVWILCGSLMGFAFGIKYISMLSIFAFLVVLFYSHLGKAGAIGMFFLNFAIIFGLDLTRFAEFENTDPMLRFVIPLVLSIIAFGFALRGKAAELLPVVKKAALFGAAIGIVFLPWVIKHASENQSFSINSILTGKSALPALFQEQVTSSGVNSTSPLFHEENDQSSANINMAGMANGALLMDADNSIRQLAQAGQKWSTKRDVSPSTVNGTAPSNSTKEEEIRRYLGYEKGINRFITYPYNNVMKKNVALWASDAGLFILLLLPLLMFAFSAKQLPWNSLKMLLLLLFLVLSVFSSQMVKGTFDYANVVDKLQKTSFSEAPLLHSLFLSLYLIFYQLFLSIGNALMPLYNALTIQSIGICFVVMTLFSGVVYFLFRERLKGIDSVSKLLVIIAYSILQYWFVLSSGIIWYGLAGFALLPILIVMLVKSPATEMVSGNKFLQKYILVCAGIWFCMVMPFQLIPNRGWSEAEYQKVNFKELFVPAFAKFAIGEYDEHSAFKNYFPQSSQNIINTLNRDKQAKILNIATFLTYQINNNDQRVYQDNQIGIFDQIYKDQFGDKLLIADEMRSLKIKYVLVDLRADKLDMTPEKTLKLKFSNLMQSMTNNQKIRLLYTDQLVQRPDGDMNIVKDGRNVIAKYDLLGERVLEFGTIALFEIL